MPSRHRRSRRSRKRRGSGRRYRASQKPNPCTKIGRGLYNCTLNETYQAIVTKGETPNLSTDSKRKLINSILSRDYIEKQYRDILDAGETERDFEEKIVHDLTEVCALLRDTRSPQENSRESSSEEPYVPLRDSLLRMSLPGVTPGTPVTP